MLLYNETVVTTYPEVTCHRFILQFPASPGIMLYMVAQVILAFEFRQGAKLYFDGLTIPAEKHRAGSNRNFPPVGISLSLCFGIETGLGEATLPK